MTPDRPLLAPLTDQQMFEDCYNQDFDSDDDDWLDSDKYGGWVITSKSLYEYYGI